MRQPSLFHHFPTKADILRALLERTLAPSLELVERLGELDASAPTKLLLHVRIEVVRILTSPFDLSAIVFLPDARGPRFRGVWTTYAKVVDGTEAMIRAGIAAGAFVTADPSLAAVSVMGLGDMTVSWRFHRLVDDPARRADFVADFAVRALLRDPSMLPGIRAEAARLEPSIAVR